MVTASVDVVACAPVAVLAAVFGLPAFMSAMSQDGHDFHDHFLPAAQAVLVGRSPYSGEGIFDNRVVVVVSMGW